MASGSLRVAAGCTDLLAATQNKVLPGPILDVTAIADLRGLSDTPDGVMIGAATTWTDIAAADLPAAMAGLQLAAREVGALQIQNRGTIGGNLCNASPAADGVPPLLTLDADVELQSVRGTRRLSLGTFLTGPRRTARAKDELVTGVFIPRHSLTGVADFQKLGARAYLVISIAMTAARITLERGIVTQVSLAVGACGPVATRLTGIETAMLGHPLDIEQIQDADVVQALSPIDDVRADATYRGKSAAELLRRTVARAAEHSEAK